jgi:hypothetical protein
MTLKDVSRSRRPPPSSGLSGLEGVPLGFKLERLLDAALAGSGGSPAWRHRKSVESRELLALSRLAPHRMSLLGLQVRQGALLTPQPGASFIQILRPEGVFLAQVPTDPPHVLCLAPVLPAGVHCKEMILMSYAALTLQNFQIDAAHPAGVFNIEAARWWQENASRIPLTREPFLESGPALEDAGR